jgi:hypothetical protein
VGSTAIGGRENYHTVGEQCNHKRHQFALKLCQFFLRIMVACIQDNWEFIVFIIFSHVHWVLPTQTGIQQGKQQVIRQYSMVKIYVTALSSLSVFLKDWW